MIANPLCWVNFMGALPHRLGARLKQALRLDWLAQSVEPCAGISAVLLFRNMLKAGRIFQL